MYILFAVMIFVSKTTFLIGYLKLQFSTNIQVIELKDSFLGKL